LHSKSDRIANRALSGKIVHWGWSLLSRARVGKQEGHGSVIHGGPCQTQVFPDLNLAASAFSKRAKR
jgi:hypothetical protein